MPTLLKQVVRHQRNWYGQWHTWAGIFAGSILLIVSLTGALLVFEQELDVWLNPQMFQFEESGERLSFEEVIQAVQAQHPDYSLNGVFVDPTRNDVYLMAIEREPEKYEQLYANPHTGAVTGIRVYQESVMGFIRHLHRTLLIPPFGKYLVGIAAIICAILMITGLRLWIPKRWNSLKARLGVKWGGSAKRVNYDFHNSLGFYFSPMITLISLTGAMITFAQVVLLFLFLLNFQSPMSISEVLDQQSQYQVDTSPITITQAVHLAQQKFPEGEVTGMSLPHDSLGAYTVNLTLPSAAKTGNRVLLFVDQYSGATIGSSQDEPYRLAKSYLNWVQPLHYGTFGGLPTRILALLASLVTAALFLTGFFIWLPRWKKRRMLGKKVPQSAPQPTVHHEKNPIV